MADEDEREAYGNSGNISRIDEKDDNKRRSSSSRDSDRHRGQRDSDRSRNDSSKHKRRRSRSRSGSRERTSSKSGRERSRREERRRSDDDDEEEGAYGSSQKTGSGDYEEEKVQQVRRDRRDDDRQNGDRITGHDWRCKLTSIRDAHFNRNKQAPVLVKNQFRNDGSFLEMFKKRMAEQAAKGEDKPSLTPNSLVLASSSIPFSPHLSLPPLTLGPSSRSDVTQQSSTSGWIDPDEDVDGVPMPSHKPLPVPVSVGKRRLAKPLKTGIVAKKPQEPEEDEASQEKLDALSRYLQEVQKYKSANCIDEDNSRPLVK